MAESDSSTSPQSRRRNWIAAAAAALVVVLFATMLIVKPAMPHQVFLLTGPEGSAYHDLGLEYAEDLRRRGLEAEVIPTKSTLDSVQKLSEVSNAVAFGPSTVGSMGEAGIDVSQLVSLGSVGLEPLWLFFRSDLEISRIRDLAERRVVTESIGTSSEHVARQLIESNGVDEQVVLQPIDRLTADVLQQGFTEKSIDAAFVAGDINSPIVESMLNFGEARFLSFDRGAAYAELIPGVTTVLAPEGVFNLERNIPQQDAQLLANTTCLIAHDSLHPSVVPMLLIAAENVRQHRKTFSNAGTFPNSDDLTLPLDPAARRYFKQGETGLSKFLPYNVTRYLNYLGFFVIPLLTAVVVLLKLVPAGLRMWGNFRLRKLFKQLETVEKGHAAGQETSKLIADLDRIDEASAAIFVPLSTVQDYIDFRQFLHDMRERIQASDSASS